MTAALAKSRSAMSHGKLRVWCFQRLLWRESGQFPHVVNFPFRWRCIQIVHVVDDIRFLWVPSCSIRIVEFLQVRWHQDRVTHDVVVHVPQVRQASVFLQCMPRVVGLSVPPSWKLAVSCTPVAWSACTMGAKMITKIILETILICNRTNKKLHGIFFLSGLVMVIFENRNYSRVWNITHNHTHNTSYLS